jgi:limonene-1,2-epoxide hydrolase
MTESAAEWVVTAYLDALGDRDFEALRTLLADSGFSYRSPVSKTENADDFINLVSRLGPILEGIERVRTFVDGNDVCSILKFRTTMEALREVPVVQLTTVVDGKIVAMEVFFDASEYNKMFDFEP